MLELFSFTILYANLHKRDQAYFKPFIKIEEICVVKKRLQKPVYGNDNN